MPIEFIKTETTDSPVTVYNFQVEDYHTYYVSDTGLLVHNATSGYISPSDQAKSWQGKGKYPGVDDYVEVTVNKGTVLYRIEESLMDLNTLQLLMLLKIQEEMQLNF